MAYKMIDGGLDITALLKSANESEADMDGWSALDRENKLYEKCNAAIINEHQILASKFPSFPFELCETDEIGEGRKYTLVFVARLRQLYSLKIAFKAIGVEVEAVTGETPKVKREASVTKFRSGETPVLINCGALIEGADLPCVSVLFVHLLPGAADCVDRLRGPCEADYFQDHDHADGESPLQCLIPLLDLRALS